MKNLYILIFSLAFSLIANAQCNGADPFCTGTSYNFPNSTGVADLGAVDCLSSSPNPAWYYMEIDQNGSMTIDISQSTAGGTGIDVDFIVWGPYSSITAACAGANPFPTAAGSGSAVVDCSYSSSATETATIPNAVVGQVYVMLLTNYSDQAGSITFSQTGGSGSADCSFTCGVALTATPSACSANTYSVSGNLTVTAGPGISVPNTGTVTIQSSCGGAAQTFNAPFTNVPYSFTGLNANGAACTITATFSNFPNCNSTQAYTAPAPCTTTTCNISSVTATPGACSNSAYGLTGNITFTNPPASGTLTVTSTSGGTQTFNAPFTSPLAYNITGQPANGGSNTVTATFSADGACTNTASYTAPPACGCAVTALTATPTACANDLYNVTGSITFNTAPATGTLTVSGCGGSQTFNAPFTSPQAYTFSNLAANGSSCTVTATFSANNACSRTQTYTAPAPCLNPPCVQDPFCTGTTLTFPAGTNQTDASTTYPNNNYGCLVSSPNPAWYYMEIANPGTLGVNMTNSSGVDLDFILYGPYSSLPNAQTFCNNMGNGTGTSNLVVDCSFSSSASETADITNAQTGEVYVLLVTNFSNSATNISFTGSGNATTDCSIVTPSNCTAQIGTYVTTVNGYTLANNKLCYTDSLSITSNNNWTPPGEIVGATTPGSATYDPNAPTYDPGIAWLVYSCPPSVSTTPAQAAATSTTINDDPCLQGIVGNTPNLTDVNDLSLINSFPAGTFTNNTVYLVPITMYSLVDGIYSYVIVPANDCFELGTPIVMQYLPQISVAQTSNCANGTISATITGGSPQLNGGNYTVVTGSQSPATATFANTTVGSGGTIVLGNLSNGPYSFDITDANGCPQTISGTFTGPQSATLTYPDNLYCLNEPSPVPTVVGTQGGVFSSGVGLSLNPANGIITLATSTAGAYSVTYTTPGPLCPASSSFNLTIEDYPIVDAGEDLTICVGKPVILSGSGASAYSWNYGAQNGVPYLPNLGETMFTVVGTSSAGCSSMDSILITVIDDCNPDDETIFWVPNSFTPDGDQYNQTFFPVFYSGYDPFKFELYIYNRWGELIWETHDVTVGWDGTYNNGLKCQDGIYTWKIRFKLMNNDEKRTSVGHVSLIK
jgi:gliding motility-associated-like protein